MSPSAPVPQTEPSEVTPLVQPSRSRTRSASKDGRKLSPLTLLIPIAITSCLAILLPTTTTLQIQQRIACLLYYYLNKPESIPPVGGIPPELCGIAEVNNYFAGVVSVLAVTDGIGVVFSCSAASYIGSRYGRKPALLGIFLVSITGRSLLVISQSTSDAVQLPLLALWSFSESITNMVSAQFIFNLYAVDVAEAAERTVALSTIYGWAQLGGALSFSLGGLITTWFNNITRVYIVSIVMHALICIYIVLVLPESFPWHKREELRREREAEAASESSRSPFRKALASVATVFEPLKQLKPTRNHATGRRNWRLVYCACYIFTVMIADGYATNSMLIYFTTHYKYGPAESGYVLTTMLITSVLVLTFVIPFIVHHLRPFYTRSQPLVLSDENTSLLDTQSTQAEMVSGDLDVHIAFFSWTMESLAYIAIGLTHTLASQLTAVVGIGLGAGRSPAFRSLVAASVEPLRQGEALAAIEMVVSSAFIFSPIVMGSIMTSTINTIPQMVFYVHAGIVLTGASMLFLVRDSDRYQGPSDGVFVSED